MQAFFVDISLKSGNFMMVFVGTGIERTMRSSLTKTNRQNFRMEVP